MDGLRDARGLSIFIYVCIIDFVLIIKLIRGLIYENQQGDAWHVYRKCIIE